MFKINEIESMFKIINPDIRSTFFPMGFDEFYGIIKSLNEILGDSTTLEKLIRVYVRNVPRILDAEPDRVKKLIKLDKDLSIEESKIYQFIAFLKIHSTNRNFNLASNDDLQILKFLANGYEEQEKYYEINDSIAKKHEFDNDYGVNILKPVYVYGIKGSKDFLNSLKEKFNEIRKWTRIGSTQGKSGNIDIYRIELEDKQLDLYINMYSHNVPINYPEVFSTTIDEIRNESENKTNIENNIFITNTSVIKTDKIEKNLDENEDLNLCFCTTCGFKMPRELKFCGDCGKKVEHETRLKLCYNCGNKTNYNAKYCHECGSSFKKTESDETTTFGNGLGLKYFNLIYAINPVYNIISIIYILPALVKISSNLNYYFSSIFVFMSLLSSLISLALMFIMLYFRFAKNKDSFARTLIYIFLFQYPYSLFVYFMAFLYSNDSYRLLVNVIAFTITFGLFAFMIIYYLNKRIEEPIFKFLISKTNRK